MATNFKIFDENKTNIFDDAAYNTNLSRLNGNSSGQIISSQLINTALHCSSLITTALMNALVTTALGINSTENEVINAIKSGLTSYIYNTTVKDATNAVNAQDAKSADYAKVAGALDEGYGTKAIPIYVQQSGIIAPCTEIDLPIKRKVNESAYADNAKNLLGGSAGALLYQSVANSTSFINPPTTNDAHLLYGTVQANSFSWKKISELFPPQKANTGEVDDILELNRSGNIITFNTSTINETDICQLKLQIGITSADSRFFIPNYSSSARGYYRQSIPMQIVQYTDDAHWTQYNITCNLYFDSDTKTAKLSIPFILETSMQSNAVITKFISATSTTFNNFTFTLHKVYQ